MSEPRTGRGSGTPVLRLTTSIGVASAGVYTTGAPLARSRGTIWGGPAHPATAASAARGTGATRAETARTSVALPMVLGSEKSKPRATLEYARKRGRSGRTAAG